MKTINLYYTHPDTSFQSDFFFDSEWRIVSQGILPEDVQTFGHQPDAFPSEYLAFVDPRIAGTERLLEKAIEQLQTEAPHGIFLKDPVCYSNAAGHFFPSIPFLVISTSLFQRWMPEMATFKTWTYALIHLGFRMQENAQPTVVFETSDPEWIAKELYTKITNFEYDYRQLVRFHPTKEEQIPAQFKITTVDQVVGIKEKLSPDDFKPVFSVICPVFKPQFVQEMIESVCDQTWQDWELILGIDGPEQANELKIIQVIESFSDPRIRYFKQKNQGTGPTRERLRKIATGDFILSIDDDDKLTPLTLEVFAMAIVKNPGINVFRGGSQIFGLTSVQLLPRPRYRIHDLSNDPFEVNQPYAIKRTLLDQLGGYQWDSDLHNAGEDTYLFHELDRLKITTGLLPLPLYLRRLSTENLTLQFEGEEAMAHFRNLEKKFGKSDWSLQTRKFDFDGNFQRYQALYTNNKEQLFLATTFFQYQTLGDLHRLTIDLEVTSRCNAVCGFCPRDAMPDTDTHISLEVVKKVAAFVQQFPGTQVVLCGIGESLLHPRLIEIVQLLNSAGAVVAMTSNGALMKLDKFKSLVESGLTHFNFSINAHTAATHREVMGMKNYDKVKQNVLQLLDYSAKHYPHIRIHASCVVCERNEHEITDFVDFWKAQGVSQVWLHPTNNRAGLLGANLKSGKIGFFAELYQNDPDVAVDIFKDHEEGEKLCKIAKSLAFISSKGEMHLCAMDYKRSISHGNLQHKSIQQMQFEKLKNCLTGSYDLFCAECDFCPSGIKQDTKRLTEA